MSVVLTVLVIWVVVLVPPALRARSRARAEFIGSFQRHLDGLERRSAAAQATAGVHAPAPRRPAAPTGQAHRRRTILATLLVAMGTSLVAGVHPEARFLWAVHLFLDDIFLGYVALLAHSRQRQTRGARAVAPAPFRVPRPAPAGLGAVTVAVRPPLPGTLGAAAGTPAALARGLAAARS